MKDQIYITLAIIFQAMAGISGKYAAKTISPEYLFPLNILTNSFYLLSLFCMFLQAIVWQQALKHFPLSFAYPFMSLFNFIILIASAVLFAEGITIGNIIGLILISIGIVIISGELKKQTDFKG